jgi:hypothetical protein
MDAVPIKGIPPNDAPPFVMAAPFPGGNDSTI